MIYIIRKVPHGKAIAKARNEFIKYYLTFNIIYSANLTLIVVCNMVVFINCKAIHKPLMNLFVTLGNACSTLLPLVLTIIRFNNPMIKKRIQKILRKIFFLRTTQNQYVEK